MKTWGLSIFRRKAVDAVGKLIPNEIQEPKKLTKEEKAKQKKLRKASKQSRRINAAARRRK